MKQLDYKVTHQSSHIRRENWKDFIDTVQGEKKHKIALLSLHFNNFNNTKKLIEYLEKETDQSFDIILIENSTKTEEADKLKEFCIGKDNITLIKPTYNIGSAGGYALGMEYIINKEYEYFFMIEDDVLFLEQDAFSDMIRYADKHTLTFIHNCKNTRSSSHPADKGKSRRVQTAGYPVNFIEKIGIIDPRYFFRGEDLEWGGRIERGIQKLGYKTHITDHDYLHPYLKSVNGSYARFYFSIRNQLFTLEKRPAENYSFFITLFFYLRTAITKLLKNKETLILKSFTDALGDFLRHDFSFENNRDKIALFLKNITKKEQIEWMDTQRLGMLSKDLYGNPKILGITGADRKKLHFSTKIGNLFTHGLLISSSSTIFTPLSLLAPKVICINEFNLTDKNISVTQHDNKNILWNALLIIISLVASLGLIIMVDIVIILSIGIRKGRKKQ